MNRPVLSLFLAAALAPSLLAQSQPPPQSQTAGEQPGKQESKKQREKREKARLKELQGPYKALLEEDLGYIISPEERAVFLKLNTSEERDQFIEQFWLRRDPTPDTVENEFKEEHYRRIAYANERFTVGTPGWMSDRGHMYILYGAPDQTDSHPTGGQYYEGPREGTRNFTSYPYERWTYRRLEGIGQDITLEFVDKNSTGDYKLTADPTEKEVFFTPGALTRNTDPQTAPEDSSARFRLLEQMNLYARVLRPPEVKFKDLEEVVTSRLVQSALPVRLRTDFFRVTDETLLVPLTVSIPRKGLTFRVDQGVHFAEANVYGRVTTLSGRVVQVFEDTIQLYLPESVITQAAGPRSVVYQKAIPLRSGLYKLVMVIKDVNGGSIGLIEQRLSVPSFDPEELSHSTLVLADLLEPAPSRQLGLGQFVIASKKVRPVVEREFRRDQQLGVYLQVYNLALNEATNRPDAAVSYTLLHGRETVLRQVEPSTQMDTAGRQLTIARLLPLSDLAPGDYVLLVAVDDKNKGQSLQVTASFRIVP